MVCQMSRFVHSHTNTYEKKKSQANILACTTTMYIILIYTPLVSFRIVFNVHLWMAQMPKHILTQNIGDLGFCAATDENCAIAKLYYYYFVWRVTKLTNIGDIIIMNFILIII